MQAILAVMGFSLPIHKLDYLKYFTCFEKLMVSLKKLSAVDNFTELSGRIQSLVSILFYNFKS